MKEKICFIGKTVLTFAALYVFAAIIMEGIVIVGFYLRGFDVLKGNMPTGYWVSLVPLYGRLGFIILTIAANHLIRKKKLNVMRIQCNGKKVAGVLPGMLVGAFLVGIAICILCAFSAYQFDGIQPIRYKIAIATFGAYLIQGTAEEVMCRGFLQNYLEEKVSRKLAILITAVVFVAPHFASLLDFGVRMVVVSVINILLVSVLFSLCMIRFNSLWVPIGVHVGWNYMLSYVCGLQLTGSQNQEGILHFIVNPAMDLLHGGAYGMEAGIIVTLILLICDIILFRYVKE